MEMGGLTTDRESARRVVLRHSGGISHRLMVELGAVNGDAILSPVGSVLGIGAAWWFSGAVG
jgi:hypothetical protein